MEEYINIKQELSENWHWKREFGRGMRLSYREGILDHLAAIIRAPFTFIDGIVDNVYIAMENAREVDMRKKYRIPVPIDFCKLKPIRGGAALAPICT